MIGIIGAMDEEITFLRDRMTEAKEHRIANALFIKGRLAHQDIVLLQSGIGKVNAAMTTTIMHEQFKPNLVINTGSAGGFSQALEVGDIVISNQVAHHDVDVTAFNYAYGQVPGMPAIFEADQYLLKQTLLVVEQLQLQHQVGLIVSGDSFLESPEKVAHIKKLFPDAIAGEMEAAAIAQVCYQYQVPFIVIRALSDIAGKESSISFTEFIHLAAQNTTELIYHVIKHVE